MDAPRETLLVAGRSARLLAEAAARAGHGVIACDVYGDADTRRAALRWRSIAGPRRRIDAALTLAALADAARQPGLIGWVAGGDFECEPELLAAGTRLLPLLGTPPEAVRRVRDMRGFFAALARLGLDHPETAFEPPRDARGWLRKDARGAGGWHIRRADAAVIEPDRAESDTVRAESDTVRADPGTVRAELVEASPSTSSGRTGGDSVRAEPNTVRAEPVEARAQHPGPSTSSARTDGSPAPATASHYWQREVAGTPMSALFVAGDGGVRCIGVHALIVRPLGAHPHVYRGAVGPLALAKPLDAALQRALALLAAEFGLRGLASLDFIHAGDALLLLEINPRPSASMALHAGLPLLEAHLAACQGATLPPLAAPPAPLRGSEIVFARRGFTLTPAQAALLDARGDCHDLPQAGSAFDAGDPVCSVTAEGLDAATVRDALAARRQAVRDALAAP